MNANLETTFSNKVCAIVYDPSTGIVTANWTGFLKMEETKDACKALFNTIRQHKATKHLSSQEKMKVLNAEIQGYVVTEVFPELAKLGLKKMAVLLSSDLFAQISAMSVHDKSNNKVGNMEIKSSDSPQECLKWLNT